MDREEIEGKERRLESYFESHEKQGRGWNREYHANTLALKLAKQCLELLDVTRWDATKIEQLILERNATHARNTKLQATNKRYKKGLIAAKELQELMCEKISDADYEHETYKTHIEETESWVQLEGFMRDGLLASYRDQFEFALTEGENDKS